MNQFQTVTSVPSNFSMTNPIQNKNTGIPDDGSCQASFNYFQGGQGQGQGQGGQGQGQGGQGQGDKGNVYWGSEKPMDETCIQDKAHTGKPAHAIWNNSTKRKTIVNV
jgi:hypothetical protein